MINFEFVANEEREYARKLCLSTPYIIPGLDYHIVNAAVNPDGEKRNTVFWEISNAGPLAYTEEIKRAGYMIRFPIHIGPYVSLSRCIYEWNEKVRDMMKFTNEAVGFSSDGSYIDPYDNTESDVVDYLYID